VCRPAPVRVPERVRAQVPGQAPEPERALGPERAPELEPERVQAPAQEQVPVGANRHRGVARIRRLRRRRSLSARLLTTRLRVRLICRKFALRHLPKFAWVQLLLQRRQHHRARAGERRRVKWRFGFRERPDRLTDGRRYAV